MKARESLALIAILGVSLAVAPAHAAAVWDIANNSVTDTRTIDFSQPASVSITDISQFSSDAAVAAGESAGTYVLSSVVLSITTTSMAGSFRFENTYETAGTINYARYISGEGVLLTAGGLQVVQTMSHEFNGGSSYPMAGKEVKIDTFNPTMAAPVSTTFTTGLEAFTGSGYLSSSSATLSAGMQSSVEAGISTLSLANGTAQISVTYNYTLVPEPTSAALLALGCAALALRRRRTA